MFADQTLTPKEAIRLCALGALAEAPIAYGALATAIRGFVSRVVGPTPEIMGHSIELLKLEGLCVAAGAGENALLEITEDGRAEMRRLLTAKVRPANTELNHLIVALKFRFLHLLAPDERWAQLDLLIEACEQELARLDDLRRRHERDEGYFAAWLAHDVGLLERHLSWLFDFRAKLAGGAAVDDFRRLARKAAAEI